MKKCTLCKKKLSYTEFHKRKDTLDGYQSRCKKCAIEIAKSHYKNYSDEFKSRSKNYILVFKNVVNNIKAKYKCCCCGFDNPICLDFHHLDSSKKDFNIAHLVTRKNKSDLVKEINKCVVVCSNCHRLVHDGQIKVVEEFICNETQEDFDSLVLLEKEKYGIATKTKRPRKNNTKNEHLCVCGNKIHKNSKSCKDCQKLVTKINWPNKEELEKLVNEKPCSVIAKELGVSDKAVEKQCKKLGIAKPPRGYWQKLKANNR
jgi:hypothetical protein